MNLTSGKFTAPRAGIYFFALTGDAYIPGSSSRNYLTLGMYLNGNSIARGYSDEISTGEQWETFSFQTTLNLQAGDQIWLEIISMSTGTSLFDDSYHSTHFSGLLLDENLSESLNIE